MKNNILAFIFIGLIFLLSCGNKPKSDVTITTCNTIPKDAIPFEYSIRKKIFLKGLLNDSIPLNIMFDTGGANCIDLTDSLRGKVGSIGKVQIGTYIKDLPIYILKGKTIPNMIGSDGAIINWLYFKDKTIKISFQHKYIQILNSNENKIGYDSITLKIVRGNWLSIPVQVHLQGKVIHENVIFDTGNNNAIYIEKSLIDKYSLKLKGGYSTTGATHSGFLDFINLNADSVGVGKHFVSGENLLSFGNLFKQKKQSISGLLGNNFLEHFDVILDFKNFVLYLKPIDKSE